MLDIYPPDEYQLYDPPGYFTATPGMGVVRLLKPDLTRVCIIFSTNPTGNGFVIPDNFQGLTTFDGLCIAANNPLLQLTFADHGALCQCGWLCSAAGGVTVHAVTLSQRVHPALFGYPQAYLTRQSAAPASPAGRNTDVRPVVLGSRPALLPRALRERLPGILGDH